jgi:NitT/TauT family transport system substrate-binding protein
MQLPLRLTLILCILLGATSCTPEPTHPFRVGVNLWPGYEFLYLAQEKGFFKERGVDLRLVEFNSLSDARRAYERGQLEALATTLIELLQIRDQSKRKPQVVRVIDYSTGADSIIARAGISSGNALKGARIGVELASLGVYVLARGLEANGLTLGDISALSMDQLSIEEAFRAGDIDAAVTYPPVANRLLSLPGASVVFSTAQIKGEVVDVLVVDAEAIQRRPQVVAALLGGFAQAQDYLTENPEDGYGIMARREGLSVEEFKAALHGGITMLTAQEQAPYFGSNGKLLQLMKTTAGVLKRTGQISSDHVPQDLVSDAFVK